MPPSLLLTEQAATRHFGRRQTTNEGPTSSPGQHTSGLAGRGSANGESLLEVDDYDSEAIVQALKRRRADLVWNAAIERLCNRASDARHRISIPPKGDGIAHGVLVPTRFEEGNDRLRDRPLA